MKVTLKPEYRVNYTPELRFQSNVLFMLFAISTNPRSTSSYHSMEYYTDFVKKFPKIKVIYIDPPPDYENGISIQPHYIDLVNSAIQKNASAEVARHFRNMLIAARYAYFNTTAHWFLQSEDGMVVNPKEFPTLFELLNSQYPDPDHVTYLLGQCYEGYMNHNGGILMSRASLKIIVDIGDRLILDIGLNNDHQMYQKLLEKLKISLYNVSSPLFQSLPYHSKALRFVGEKKPFGRCPNEKSLNGNACKPFLSQLNKVVFYNPGPCFQDNIATSSTSFNSESKYKSYISQGKPNICMD